MSAGAVWHNWWGVSLYSFAPLILCSINLHEGQLQESPLNNDSLKNKSKQQHYPLKHIHPCDTKRYEPFKVFLWKDLQSLAPVLSRYETKTTLVEKQKMNDSDSPDTLRSLSPRIITSMNLSLGITSILFPGSSASSPFKQQPQPASFSVVYVKKSARIRFLFCSFGLRFTTRTEARLSSNGTETRRNAGAGAVPPVSSGPSLLSLLTAPGSWSHVRAAPTVHTPLIVPTERLVSSYSETLTRLPVAA